VVDHPL
jgi:hypothetical protein